MTVPVAIEAVGDAIAQWVRDALPAVSIHRVEPQASGAPVPAPPRVQVIQLSPAVAIGEPEERRQLLIMLQRVTVTAGGPASAGVDFRLGFEETPARIEADLLAGDDAEAGAAKLLLELQTDLPAGVTATLDPEDPASILVEGTEAEPLFSCAPVGVTAVSTLRERRDKIYAEWSRMTWRLSFAAEPTRGHGTAQQLLDIVKAYRRRRFVRQITATGWEWKGVLLDTSLTPAERDESTAEYDFALEGYATIAFQDPAMRYSRLEFAAAQ